MLRATGDLVLKVCKSQKSIIIVIIIIIIISSSSSSSSTHGGDNEWRQPRGHPPQQHLWQNSANPTLIDSAPNPNIAAAD